MSNELIDIASMLEWQAKNALDNGRMNVEIDAKVIVPQIVAAMRSARPEAAPTEWKVWFGGACPLPPETPVEIVLRDGGHDDNETAGVWVWRHNRNDGDIIAYRVLTSAPQRDER